MESTLDAQNLRAMLLSEKEDDADMADRPGDCFEMNWAKDHWIIRFNRKKVGVIDQDDVSEETDLRDNEFVLKALSILKMEGLEALSSYLEGV